MVRDVYRFLIPTILLGMVGAWFQLHVLAALCLVAGAFLCYFFRNPERDIPGDDNLVVSPADGKVVRIQPLLDEAGRSKGHRISIFLNIFDVHVNRSPIAGTLAELKYHPGRFHAAFRDVASDANEQNILTIEGPQLRLVVRQIAGLLARRVVCWNQVGEALQRGERLGLIRFGSRVDLELPESVRLRIAEGDRVRGGSSVIGEYS